MSKWFFALSEASLGFPGNDWADMIRKAVASARQNTALQPHFIYDGKPSGFTAELEAMGVVIVWRTLTFLPNLVARWKAIGKADDPQMLATIAGAYLRTDIPTLDLADEFILYTDCDVMFLRDPEIARFRPTFFACAPQRYPDDVLDMNSGVMVMNVPKMRVELHNFWHYIVNNFERFGAHDQDALREYYTGRYDALPLEMNWKPYWGRNQDARIVHFHGPKPAVVRSLIQQPDFPVPPIYRELYQQNPAAYRDYLAEWSGIDVPQPLGA